MQSDIVGAGSRLLPAEDYAFIMARVPIVCVDVLLSPKEDSHRVGLIRRTTYSGGEGWCLIGGRVLRNESLTDAVERHVGATVGSGMTIDRSTLRFGITVEYFSEQSLGQFYDPRKHAVALSYTATCEGAAEASGEALDFRWFDISELPGVDFGFGQGRVVSQLLAATARGQV